jgi:hypothetical protein
VEIAQFVLQVAQTVAVLLSCLSERRHRMPEQSSEGKPMATRILAPHPNGTKDHPWDVEEDFQDVTEKVNEAIRIGEKFVALKVEGKDRAFVATEISSIFEV